MKDDVGIVGAGPAGTWTALKLAEAGARVVIFDASHPREKPCGGGLTGRALSLVARVLAEAPLESVAVRSACFDGEGSASRSMVPLEAHGLSAASSLIVVSRAKLDAALLAAAVARGARLVPERVVDIQCTSHGVRTMTSSRQYASDFLIGADGVNSLVRRRVAVPFMREQLSIAAGFFVLGVSSTAIHIRTVNHPPGYLWSFPRADHLAVGTCARADRTRTATPLREYTSRWLRESGIASGAPLRFYSWPIPTLARSDLAQERPAGPHWMLVGDAAGLVDPLTREGIYFALRSGELAAEALGSADRASASSRYRERLKDEIYPELQSAATLMGGFFSPAFTNLFIHALETRQSVRDIMVDLIAGRQPYRNLRRRLLATGEVGLALSFAALRLQRLWQETSK